MALRIDDVDLQRDRRLVERFQEGDHTAFDTLYRRYFARLQRFCLKRVGDPHEAEEIAQEAFTRALRALPDLAGERRFYPWMTVIAGRLCVDHHRRRGRSEPAATIELGSVDGGQDAIVDQADFALLGRALERLAPRHREVLAFREERGWTYQQIADHYEVPVGTVEALLFRARKALKREFLAIAGVGNGTGNGAERWAGWAGLPALGWIGRRLAALKAKTAAAWSSVGGPAAVPVLGVVAVVGSVAAVGVGVVPDALDRPRPASAVRSIPDASTSLASAAAGGRTGSATPATEVPASSAVTGATKKPSDYLLPAAPRHYRPPEKRLGPIEFQQSHQAKNKAEENSIGAEEENTGTWVFVNPDVITDRVYGLIDGDD